jgi:hypothetical protein
MDAGYAMPPPESLSDEEVALEVWEVILCLAELHGYLDSTNHLSDRLSLLDAGDPVAG